MRSILSDLFVIFRMKYNDKIRKTRKVRNQIPTYKQINAINAGTD